MHKAPRCHFPVVLPVKCFKTPLSSSILVTCHTHLNILDLITMTILVYGVQFEVTHCKSFFIPHSHPFWAEIFASGSCFQIPVSFISTLM